MNPYIIPVTCSICGGPGIGSVKDGYNGYFRMVHQNPERCRDYLERQTRKEQQKNADAKAALLQTEGSGI